MKSNSQKAYFAGGCFWGVEYYFQNAEGVLSTKVGYMGGVKEHPTYEEVCSGRTGHTETVEVTYDGTEATYKDLVKLFFEIHDSSQMERQGNDIGNQYRSAIYYTSNNQKLIAQRLMNTLRNKGYQVVTELKKANIFWPAENYHQKYFSKKQTKPFCHVRKKIW